MNTRVVRYREQPLYSNITGDSDHDWKIIRDYTLLTQNYAGLTCGFSLSHNVYYLRRA